MGGRPSERCFLCSQRQVRCDRKRPHCTQCLQKGSLCPGYRPAISMDFRNENQETARKVQNRVQKKTIARQNQLGATSKSAAKPQHFELPIKTVAMGFLLSKFFRWTVMELVSEFVHSCPESSPAWVACQAAALAALGRERQDEKIIYLARIEYSEAMKKINAALKGDVAQHDTLASVLYLNIFETIMVGQTSSEDAWKAHLRGFLALLKKRGMAQLETAVGCHLYRAFTAIIRTSCMIRGMRVPHDFRLFDAEAARFICDGATYQYRQIMDHVSDVYHEFSSPGLAQQHEPCGLARMKEVRQLDDGLRRICDSMMTSEHWKYSRYTNNDGKYDKYAKMATGRADQYSSLLAVRHWNMVRQLRMFLNRYLTMPFPWGQSVTIAVPPLVSQEERDIATAARATFTELANDTLATVPQYLAELEGSHKGYNYLIVPLASVAYQCHGPESEIAQKFLYHIGNEASSERAFTLARVTHLLKQHGPAARGDENWLAFAADYALSFTFSSFEDAIFSGTVVEVETIESRMRQVEPVE